jgi:cholesterol transport system auxiliary component
MMRILAATALAVGLAGCSILSSPDPIQLYRFGNMDLPPTAPAAERTVVVLNPIDFPEGAGGDRILTANGGQVAYLAGARWIGPSEQLFRSAIETQFLRNGRSVTLSDQREAPRSGLALDLDVTSFEARYLNGVEAAPTVVIAARARLIAPDRSVAAERTFQVEQSASENRVSAVVDAFDSATDDFTGQLAAWVDATAR